MESMKAVLETMKTDSGCSSSSVAVTEGIVVSGGNGAKQSVELFIPGSGSCRLPSLPHERAYHTSATLNNNNVVVCAGDTVETQYECQQFPSTSTFMWENYVETPNIGGQDATAWVTSEGLVLVTSDKALVVNTQKVINFRDSHRVSGHSNGACAIFAEDHLILTGGRYNERMVTKFNSKLEGERLPSMTQERDRHGCGSYYKGSSLVLLVAGGYKKKAVSSVEILEQKSSNYWVTAQSLPGPIGFVSSVSLGNKVYVIGGYNGDKKSKQVLAFDGKTWKKAGELQNARSSFASTKVNADKMKKFCM